MARKRRDDVSIGKFDILATYTYARGLLVGLPDDQARERGMVAAIMGARARLGHHGAGKEAYEADKHAAERKKRGTITAESFDRQVSSRMGKFFDDVFLPTMKRLVQAGLSYDSVKRLLEIPATWGAKITGEQFRERTAKLDLEPG